MRIAVDHPDAVAVKKLLEDANLPLEFQLDALDGGRNNRVFRVTTVSDPVFLKWYFHHASDNRDRLKSEFAFTQFAWSNDVCVVPKPLARHHDSRMALFEFVDGRRLELDELHEDHVRCAADFVTQVNRFAGSGAARNLPDASEACFSVREHLLCIEQRVKRLEQIDGDATSHADAIQFVGDQLVPAHEKVAQFVEGNSNTLGDIEGTLPQAQRCLSPSDFGFHNALLTPENTIRFIDFEYAGWDDPAKLVCDFFCQIEVPVPREHFDHFAESIAGDGVEQSLHLFRMRLLLPLYRIKWCCIVLNEFLTADGARRRFSGEDLHAARLAAQLDKAQAVLSRLDKDLANFGQEK